MTNLIDDLSFVLNDLLDKNNNFKDINIISIKKKIINQLDFQFNLIENIKKRIEFILIIINYLQTSSCIFAHISLAKKFIEKNSFPKYFSIDDNLKIISFLDFFNNIYESDKSQESIIRALINNSYFFDDFENNLLEINIILKYPEKFFITISEKHFQYVNNCLKYKIKLKNVDCIIHHAITLAFIYKLINSKELLDKFIHIYNDLLELDFINKKSIELKYKLYLKNLELTYFYQYDYDPNIIYFDETSKYLEQFKYKTDYFEDNSPYNKKAYFEWLLNDNN
jgi:hypothetical protein